MTIFSQLRTVPQRHEGNSQHILFQFEINTVIKKMEWGDKYCNKENGVGKGRSGKREKNRQTNRNIKLTFLNWLRNRPSNQVFAKHIVSVQKSTNDSESNVYF